MKSLRPVTSMWRAAMVSFLRWQLRHLNPMAPFHGAMVIRLNNLERPHVR
jgi:hypothetical protein